VLREVTEGMQQMVAVMTSVHAEVAPHAASCSGAVLPAVGAYWWLVADGAAAPLLMGWWRSALPAPPVQRLGMPRARCLAACSARPAAR
jgi:hypothetical protein